MCAACGKPIAIPLPKTQPRPKEVDDLDASPALPKTSRLGRKELFRKKLTILLAAAIFLTCFGLLAWQVTRSVGGMAFFQTLRQRNERALCMNNLGRIARALNEYAATHGTYPPPVVYDSEGKALYSWRVLILNELREFDLHNQFRFDEPWDSDHNSNLLGTRCPRVYISPGRPGLRSVGESNYFLIVGEGTIFPSSNRSLGPSDIKDGPSNTLLVVEASNFIHEWSKPIDIDFSFWQGNSGGLGVGGTHADGFTAAFADGRPAWVPAQTPPEMIRCMITESGNEAFDRSPFVQ